MITEAMYDWTGLYGGLNAGYGFGGDDRVGLNPTFGRVGDLEVSGIFGGAQIGYNHQTDRIVLGVEGDIQLSGISDDDRTAFDMSSDVNFFGTLRVRGGLAFDQTMIYATGGLAFADIDYKVQGAGVNINDNYSKLGYAVGAGIEHAFDEDWSVKLEYLYVGLGRERLSDAGETTYATPSFHAVRVGVNYRF